MTSKIPRARKESSTSEALIDATEAILLDEGYSAISTRKIGERAGVKSPLIHYYFKSIDDLYLAVFRRAVKRSGDILASQRPVMGMWESNEDPQARLGAELTALASHRPALRAELTAYAGRVRTQLVSELTKQLERDGAEPGIPPTVAAMLLTSVARQMRLEKGLGITSGHEETRTYIMQWLANLEDHGGGPPGLNLGLPTGQGGLKAPKGNRNKAKRPSSGDD